MRGGGWGVRGGGWGVRGGGWGVRGGEVRVGGWGLAVQLFCAEKRYQGLMAHLNSKPFPQYPDNFPHGKTMHCHMWMS